MGLALRFPRTDGSRPKNRVRAHSWVAGGEWEREWRCTFSAGMLARHVRIMRAHRRRLSAQRRATKDPRRAADLAVPSKNGLDILEALVAMAAGGRRLLAVSYRELAARADCSVETVRRQIALLKAAGMLKWQRRCRRTEAERRFGEPQWEQAENVYQLLVPAGVKRQHQRAADQVDHARAEAVRATALAQQRSAEPPPPRHPPPPPSSEAPTPCPAPLVRSGRSLADALARGNRVFLTRHETHK